MIKFLVYIKKLKTVYILKIDDLRKYLKKA